MEVVEVDLPLNPSVLRQLGVEGLRFGHADIYPGSLSTGAGPIEDEHGNQSRPERVSRVDGDRYYLQHDPRERYPVEDDTFAWCHAEDFIEHLELDHGIAWLAEVRRILQPRGIVRISTPDLRGYLAGYGDDSTASGRPGSTLNQIFMVRGLRWLYDFEELRYAVTRAGFEGSAIERRGIGDGGRADVAALDSPSSGHERLYVEALKI